MLVVLDSNVLVSAFLWQQNLKPIYAAVKSGGIIPCFTEQTWDELRRVLNYQKFTRQLAKIDLHAEEILKLISSRAYFTKSIHKIDEIKDDPSDNELLACAVSSGATFLVSGDRHLLTLKQFANIPILTPSQFLKTFPA